MTPLSLSPSKMSMDRLKAQPITTKQPANGLELNDESEF